MKRSPPKGSVSRQQPAAKRERKHTNTNTQNEIADRLLSPQVNMAHELRKLVDSANAPIFGIDAHGNVNEWNFKTAEITGYSREEAFDKPLVKTFIAPRFRESVQEVLDKALTGIETANYELEFDTKSNETRFLLVNASTRRDIENNIVGVVGVAQDVTDATFHDRAVAAAAAMAKELRQLVDTANAPIFGIDLNGLVNEWNNKTAEITGYTKKEAIGKPLVSRFIVLKLRESVQKVLDNALKGQETSNYELEFRTKSDEVRYLLVNATTRRDEENNIVGVVGVAQDVTETAKHDREVAAMANELRQLVDSANAPIFGIDVRGRVNEWNEKTAEITGYSKEEAFNKPLVSTFIMPDFQKSVQYVLDQALRGNETSNYELEFCSASDEIRYLLVNATSRRDAENNIVGVVGVAQDVTETKRNDRFVAAMASELRLLIETANAPIFGIDQNGLVNEWNQKTAEITGYPKEEAMKKPLVSTFIVPKLQKSVQEVMTNALQGNERSNYELEFRTKTDEVRYLLVNATTRRDQKNNIVGVVGVAQDVTESTNNERSVCAMAEELRQFVDKANAPIFGIDKEFNVNEWNDKTAEITGFSSKEAIGKPLVSTFIVPKLQASVRNILVDALEGKETSNYELEFTTKGNEIRYLLVNATTRRDPDANIVGVVGVAQDVTESSKNDRAVAAMAHELRQLVETANAPIFGIDVDGNVNEWNDKTAEITGFPKEDALNKPLVSTFIVPSLRQSVNDVMNKALRGVETSNYELEFETKSKEIRYLLVNATTRRDAEYNITGVVGVAQDVTESTKNDRAMTAMANELRQLVDKANAPIFGIDVEGLVNEWNDKTAEITGYSRQEAVGNQMVEKFIVPSLRQSVREVLDNALKGIETSNYELEFRTKSNEVRYLLVNATTRRNDDKAIIGVVGVAQDVTEAAKHDRAVAAMANELRQLVDTANAPIFGIDLNGLVNEWNEKTVEITGYSKDEAIGKPLVTRFIVESLRGSVQEILDNALNGKETSNYELEFKTKKDEIRYLLVNATTRRDVEGNIVGVVGVAQDVTEAAQHDRAVAVMANELRQLVDTANAPIFGIDANGDVNEWNNKTAEITGFTKEEALGKHLVHTFIVSSLRDSVQEVLDNALKGVETSNYELEFRTKSNEIRYLLVNATTRRDVEDNVIGVVGVAQDVTEAAKHDRAVAAMANELRQLIETANAPIFGIDVKGLVNEWNEKTAEITGFSKAEALNQPLVDTFIVPSLRKSVNEVMDNALNGEGTSNYELEFRTKGNENRYLLVNATTRKDADDNIIGVVGVAQDVTETAKHDRAVAVMANELRQLVDTANAPIFGIDVEGNVNEWNNKTAEITGYSKEEALGKHLVKSFIVPNLHGPVTEILSSALNGKETSNYELEFRTKTNEFRFLLVNATTRRNAENRIIGVVGVAQDVTEAAQRDRAVSAMANELRQLVDTANAPIFGIDVKGRVNEWNDKTAEITGYSKDEAVNKPLVSTFIVPKLRPSVQKVLDNALQGNETSNYELEFETKKKEIRYLLVNATTRRDDNSNIVGVVGVAQDVTDDRKHSQELREMQYIRASQEAKVETERNMTAYFAHELRNPLHSIDSALISMPERGMPVEAQSLVDAMKLCTGFMSSIMNNLLDVRKMEEGKMTLTLAPIYLDDILNSVYKMLVPSVRPGVVFRKECKVGNRGWVLGDAHRIQQVMTNVVTNAIKYTTTGSIVLIMEWADRYLQFECCDTGPGIPKKEQKKLFERFVQRGGAPGTGLGLAIAKHLVDLTGGSIRFYSDPTIKSGTSCVVKMPLKSCETPEEVLVEDLPALIQEPISVLIIDDVKMNRLMLSRRMNKGVAPNASIMEACTGEEALKICGTNKFDVIVVDQYMEEAGGVMVGTDVVFAMRRQRIDSIIIGCSGNDIDDLFISAGADWVWKKPMPSNSTIVKQLRVGLKARKASREASKFQVKMQL